VLAATAAALVLAPDAPILAQAARGFPYVALGAAILLSWRLHRTRLFVAACALAIVHAALEPTALGRETLAYALCAVFLPLGFALLSFAGEHGFRAAQVRNQAALALGPLLVAAFFSAGDPVRAAAVLTHDLVNAVYTDWSGLSQPALFATVCALGVLFARALRSRQATEAGLMWVTFATAIALASPAGSETRGLGVLAAALVMIVTLVENAYTMAFYDELTGLPGRRALTQTLNSLQPPYAIAIVDVDNFKSFNDRHGHDVGDQVLRMVAARLAAVGGGGKAFRAGGEEFTIVFPRLDKRDALPHVEEVRAAVADAPFAVRKLPRPRAKKAAAARGRGDESTQQLQVTFSAGVATAYPGGSADTVVKKADKAMYRAKTEGRNRVVT